MALLDIVSSVFGGGLTGLIGVGVQRVFEYKSKQLDVQMLASKNAHEVDMKRAEAEIMAQEWAARTRVAEVESAGKEAVADAQAFSVALTAEPQRYSDPAKISPVQMWLMVFLDFVRGLVRPSLTLYLCVLTTIIYYQARSLIGSGAIGLNPDQAVGLVRQIIETVLYLTTTCTLFWFGSRNKESLPKQK